MRYVKRSWQKPEPVRVPYALSVLTDAWSESDFNEKASKILNRAVILSKMKLSDGDNYASLYKELSRAIARS